MEYKKGFLLMDEPHWITPDILRDVKGDYAVGYNPVDDCDTIEIYDGDETIGFFHLNPERDFAAFRATDCEKSQNPARLPAVVAHDVSHKISERLVRNFKPTYATSVSFGVPIRDSRNYASIYATIIFTSLPMVISDAYITYTCPYEFRIQHFKSFEELYDFKSFEGLCELNIMDEIKEICITDSFDFLRFSPNTPDFRRKFTEFLDEQFAAEVRHWDIIARNATHRCFSSIKNCTWFSFINYKKGSRLSHTLPDNVMYCPHHPTLKITKENYKTYFPDIGKFGKDDELILEVQTKSLFGDRVEFIDLRDN